ncbi:hypothetical protein HKCCSP123_06235 [Rhodobacterales bacterium HKCCSP123]|nr:hypothetical protein [Rhodobacterales bacterium HKCCSP123]
MPETSEIIAQSRATIDEHAKKGRPKTKDVVARERIAQGQVLPPMFLQRTHRIRTNTIADCRRAISTITNAVVSGNLDHDVARSVVWMITQVINALKAQREDEALRGALDRLQEATKRLEKLGMANVIDIDEVRRAVGQSNG